MIELTSIKITPNLQLRLISKNTSTKIKWNNEFNNTEKFEYLVFLTDSEAEISTLDWCIVTNPFDGDKYCEPCKKVTFENNRKIFYGIEETRCLLIDAVKIVGTTNTLLKEVNQIIITEEMLREYYNKPLSFMEEDLLE